MFVICCLFHLSISLNFSLGQVKQRFHTGHIPFCVKFNPDDDKQNMFLSGMQNKKILQWDTRTGEVVQVTYEDWYNFFEEDLYSNILLSLVLFICDLFVTGKLFTIGVPGVRQAFGDC